jgi:hypothetical protein
MPRIKFSGSHYTAKEVKEKLGITQGRLNTYIRNGTLKPFTPPGKKQGVYRRNEVDQLARELQVFEEIRQTTSSTFTQATKADLKATVQITRVLFGLREGDEETLARRLTWVERNPDTFYVLKSEDQVVGYAAMLPLKPDKIEKILSGEESSQLTNADEIEEFKSGKPLTIYLMAAGVIPGLSHYEKRSYGARIVSGMINAIIDLGRKGVIIDTLAARSDTPDGIRIMKKGFTEITSTTHARNFVIKVRESGMPFVQEYKQALLESGQLSARTWLEGNAMLDERA